MVVPLLLVSPPMESSLIEVKYIFVEEELPPWATRFPKMLSEAPFSNFIIVPGLIVRVTLGLMVVLY